MNSLSKLQMLMVVFLLTILAALLFGDLLLLLPAALLFVLQIVISNKSLKNEYPEDWIKYSLVFIIYELILIVVFYFMMSSMPSLLNLEFIYNLFFLVLVIIILTISLKLFIGRKYAYGTVIFSTGNWVGVHLKGDLFSKINEANYAVENPKELKAKKGDRVKIATRGMMGKSVPNELLEVLK